MPSLTPRATHGRKPLHRSANPALLEPLERRRLLSVITKLATFTGAASFHPAPIIAIDAAGNLFGTTIPSSGPNFGIVWELKKNGSSYASSVNTLFTFTDKSFGIGFSAGVVIDSQGNLFGLSSTGLGTNGSSGALWELPKTLAGYGTPQLLKTFDSGEVQGQLFVDSHDNLFGTGLSLDGTHLGSIFEYSQAGGYRIISSIDGFDFAGSLIEDIAGNLFGTLDSGNNAGNGEAFEVPLVNGSYSSTATVLAAFSGINGSNPSGTLAIDSNGNLFGTSQGDVFNFDFTTNANFGTVWELPITNGIRASSFTPLGTLDGSIGGDPIGGAVLDSNGNLFGTFRGTPTTSHGFTVTGSTLWEVSPAASTHFTSVDTSTDDIQGSLVSDGQGNFFAVAPLGGTDGSGAIYKLSPPSAVTASQSHLAFASTIGGAKVGTTLAPISVNILKGDNTLDSANNSQVTLSVKSPSGASFTGTATVTAVNGVATFTGLSFANTGSYTLQATDGDLTATSNSFSINLGVGKIAFNPLAPRFQVLAGRGPPSPLVVRILDSKGNLLTDDTSSVTLSIAPGGPAGATLGGTTTVNAVGGVASFDSFTLNKMGKYTLIATDGTLTAKSPSFSVVPDLSTEHLVLTQQPTTALVGTSFAPAIIARVQDQFGNIETTPAFLGSVSISIAAGPTGSGFIGTSHLTPKKGLVTFSKLALSTAGTYTVSLTDSQLGDPTPAQFSLTINPGTTSVTLPHIAASYSSAKPIPLSFTFKSTAPSSIPFTATATIIDQNHTPLGTAAINAKGQAAFSLTNLFPGTYTCTLTYPGDPNYTPLTSLTFTLHITAPR